MSRSLTYAQAGQSPPVLAGLNLEQETAGSRLDIGRPATARQQPIHEERIMTIEEKASRADRLVFWCSMVIAAILVATGVL